MSIKLLPYGISNYETIIRKGYAYVDKTMYIRSLEPAGHYILFLRPRRFGKSLFTSTLGYYYDINQKDNFDFLFSGTDIGRNPTEEKNAYYVMQFDFSGIRTDSIDIMLESFTNNVHDALRKFCIAHHLDITLKVNSPEAQLSHLFTEFQAKCDGKIYVIIDEYDHFANELLGAKPDVFKKVVGKEGFVHKWYEILKRETKTIVDRIFITGVSPITLDNLTSGFSVAKNFSMRSGFNEMMGFTTAEVEQLIQETIAEELPMDLMDTLTEYYNGYFFSEDGRTRVFNSDMVLYYLDHYQQEHKPPRTLLDHNAVSDYGKLAQLMRFKTPDLNIEALKEIVFNAYTISTLVSSFSFIQQFKPDHFKSLLFYLGLLTIKELNPDPDAESNSFILEIPNEVMKGLYFDFLMEIITEDEKLTPNISKIKEALRQVGREDSCEKLTILMGAMLHSLSNRDSLHFAEKDLKILLALFMMMSELYIPKSEYEVERRYIDLVFLPKSDTQNFNTLLFELKYIKKSEKGKKRNTKSSEAAKEKAIAEAISGATEQLKRYSSAEEFSGKKISAFAIVFVGDECVYREKVQVE